MSKPSKGAFPNGRLFYSLSSLLLLLITFAGFRLFYMEGKAFPGHPLPPPTRTLLIVHGVMMTVWILLAVVQPWLIAGKQSKVHMALGKFGAVLAALILVVGIMTGIESIRITPPELVRFSLAPKAFLIIPLSSVILFAAFVLVGVINRKNPEIHRPMMFLATLSVVSAALGRIPAVNQWIDGTALEQWLTAFVTTVILGVILWVVKSLIQRKPDRWFAIGVGVMALWFFACSQFARTDAWDKFAGLLLGGW